MRRLEWGPRSELLIALVLLVGAVGLDLLWVGPQQREVRRLQALRAELEVRALDADRRRAQAAAVLRYVSPEEGDWKDLYRSTDALQVLERLRRETGVRLLDLRLGTREPGSPFERTIYYVAAYGPFDRQIRFLRALEQARPLVRVDSFTMDRGLADPAMTCKLNLSFLTLSQGDTP